MDAITTQKRTVYRKLSSQYALLSKSLYAGLSQKVTQWSAWIDGTMTSLKNAKLSSTATTMPTMSAIVLSVLVTSPMMTYVYTKSKVKSRELRCMCAQSHNR